LPDGRLAGSIKYAGFLVRELQSGIARKKTMAYIGKETHDPVWLPESLPEEILAESFIELLNTEAEGDNTTEPGEPSFGFIVRDWFGPYLLSPPTRFLRGRC
jgi:hypothetical protein